MDNKREKITQLVYKAVDEINKNLPADGQLHKTPETILIGDQGYLDSLGMVNLIVAVEQNVEEEFKKTITLANDEAMSLTDSPFKTINSMVNYIESLV